MNAQLMEDIVVKYPKLFPNRYKEQMETGMCEPFGCGDGYAKLIMQYCEAIKNISTATILDITTSFGTLNFYTDLERRYTLSDNHFLLNTISHDFKSKSLKVCSLCGKEGRMRKKGEDKRVLCPFHMRELGYTHIRQREVPMHILID